MKKRTIPFCTRRLSLGSSSGHSKPEAVDEITQQENLDGGGDLELPDRVLHPQQYDGEMNY